MVGSDPLRIRLALEAVRRAGPVSPEALAALDMALLDILGKVAGLPLFVLLGGMRDQIRTSATVGILPPDQTVKKARDLIGQGFTSLKLKGGVDVESDIERFLKVREAVGDGVELSLDANQGYAAEESLRFIRGTKAARLVFLEQPTPRRDLELLGYVSSMTDLPVMADESLLTLDDAVTLARRGVVDLFNVKVMKVGGIIEAQQIAAVARAFGIGVMVGSTDEAALGIAAGLAVALADPAVQRADLDGNLPLEGDPSSGAVILSSGSLSPTGRPGLGLDLDA